MPATNIATLVYFIRGVEPRYPIDLAGTLREQIRLTLSCGLTASWLLQYDALIRTEFTEPLKRELGGTYDIGIWLEVVEPLVRKAGIPWRGRYAWDWHAHVGFSVGYTPEERERLVDVLMDDFKVCFGRYPRTVGSWMIDAHTLAYLHDRYGIEASCNCRDQRGTDGYTLWGGYFNQAYYPSRLNSFIPAQTAELAIPVPVFRMLGSDPIYQYDAPDNGNGQDVVTLEPAYAGDQGGGGIPSWVRWFFAEEFRDTQLSFGYAQIGQENSFGWEAMKAGLTDQLQLTAALRREGKLSVMTLAEAAAWYAERYPHTPPSSVIADTDWRGEGRSSFWYCSRFYRVNLLLEKGILRIRDLHLFDERYEERYLTTVCETEDFIYDTLPVVDGGSWSTDSLQAAVWPYAVSGSGGPLPFSCVRVETEDCGDGSLRVSAIAADGNRFTVRCGEASIRFESTPEDWELRLSLGELPAGTQIEAAPQALSCRHRGFAYEASLRQGSCETAGEPAASEIRLVPEGGGIELALDWNRQ